MAVSINKGNIEYSSKEILDYYNSHRQNWEQFYPSEKWVFERITEKEKTLGDVLDVGCACGGLAVALSQKLPLTSYTGIDIHKQAIDWARRHCRCKIPLTFIAGDILWYGISKHQIPLKIVLRFAKRRTRTILNEEKNLAPKLLPKAIFLRQNLNRTFDTVVSLSCADWNIETRKIIDSCWDRVKENGYFVISLRLTLEQGVNDIQKSYQRVNFSGKDKYPEIANYVVFNFKETMEMMKRFSPAPELVGAYGYWGKPSPMAITPFDKLAFAVFYIKKRKKDDSGPINTELELPQELLQSILGENYEG